MQDTKIMSLENKFTDIYLQKGYKNVVVDLQNGCKKGEGYLGLMIRAVISGEKNGKKEVFDTMIKCAPKGEKVRKYLPTTRLFQKEILFYNTIIPRYENIQKELKVPEELICNLPRCFKTSEEYLEEFLNLENLRNKGYVLCPASAEQLDFNHSEVALKMLGKFHSLSFIFEKRHKNEFDHVVSKIDNVLYYNSYEYDCSGLAHFFKESLHKYISCIENEENKNMVIEVIGGDLFATLKSYIEKPGKMKVISHSDFWINNMMFKYQDNRPIEALPLDFQLTRYESPINDFIYFFATSSEASLRRNHFWQLFEVYHNSMKDFITACGYDVNEFCSYEDLKSELHKQANFGLALSIFVTPFFTLDEILEPTEIFSGNLPECFYNNTERYKKRINDFVTDYVNLGFLK